MHTKVLGVPDLALRPTQYRDSLCVGLGMLPVTEGITAPPFISRAFAFSCIPELISRRLIRVNVPPNHSWDFKCHLQADRVLKSWILDGTSGAVHSESWICMGASFQRSPRSNTRFNLGVRSIKAKQVLVRIT